MDEAVLSVHSPVGLATGCLGANPPSHDDGATVKGFLQINRGLVPTYER